MTQSPAEISKFHNIYGIHKKILPCQAELKWVDVLDAYDPQPLPQAHNLARFLILLVAEHFPCVCTTATCMFVLRPSCGTTDTSLPIAAVIYIISNFPHTINVTSRAVLAIIGRSGH